MASLATTVPASSTISTVAPARAADDVPESLTRSPKSIVPADAESVRVVDVCAERGDREGGRPRRARRPARAASSSFRDPPPAHERPPDRVVSGPVWHLPEGIALDDDEVGGPARGQGTALAGEPERGGGVRRRGSRAPPGGRARRASRPSRSPRASRPRARCPGCSRSRSRRPRRYRAAHARRAATSAGTGSRSAGARRRSLERRRARRCRPPRRGSGGRRSEPRARRRPRPRRRDRAGRRDIGAAGPPPRPPRPPTPGPRARTRCPRRRRPRRRPAPRPRPRGSARRTPTRTHAERSIPSGTAWHASNVTVQVCGASSASRRARRAWRNSPSTESPYPVFSSSVVVPWSAISRTSGRQNARTSSSEASANIRALR